LPPALQLDAPLVGSTYSFDELPAALEHLQSGKSVGKVVIKVEHENGNGRLLL
jgi:NADPH-dependent curcumin reductase CurA